MPERAPLESAENEARRLAAELDSRMPPGWGFGLILYTKGEAGYMTWISSGRREDMKKAMQELIAKWDRESPTV